MDEVEVAVAAAAARGAEGDPLLAEALPALRDWRQLAVTAALGQARGPHGGAALTRVLLTRGPGLRDVLCAAALALAKRRDALAAEAITQVLTSSRDGVVREYAVMALAYIGDGSSWDAVFDWLSTQLRRTERPNAATPVPAFAISYLLTCGTDIQEHAERVASLLRSRWRQLQAAEVSWLATHWPELHPDGRSGPATPNPSSRHALKAWVADHPLFQAE